MSYLYHVMSETARNGSTNINLDKFTSNFIWRLCGDDTPPELHVVVVGVVMLPIF